MRKMETRMADLLVKHRAIKKQHADLRVEVLDMLVGELGVEEEFARQLNWVDFLEGYLQAKGVKRF